MTTPFEDKSEIEVVNNNSIPEAGKWYFVSREPEFYKNRTDLYQNFGKIGYCKWVRHDYLAAYLSFAPDNDEMVLFYCLTEASPQEIAIAKEKIEQHKKMSVPTLNSLNIKLTAQYKIIKVPDFWTQSGAEIDTYPSLGKVGRIKKVLDGGVILVMNNEVNACQNNHYIPYECLEMVVLGPKMLDGDILLQRIRQNPEGLLHLLKGLGKVTKNPVVRLFVETSRFPETF